MTVAVTITMKRVRVLKKKPNQLDDLLHSLNADKQRMAHEQQEEQVKNTMKVEADESEGRVNNIIDEIFMEHKLVEKAQEEEESEEAPPESEEAIEVEETKEVKTLEPKKAADKIQVLIDQLNAKHEEKI